MIPCLDEQMAIAGIAQAHGGDHSLISCAEYLAAPEHLKSHGLLSWDVGSLRNRWLAGGLSGAVLGAVLRYPNVLWLLALRGALAVAILLGPAALVTNPWVIGGVALLGGLFVIRNSYGQDGADQMSWIIFSGLTLVSLVATPAAATAFLWFVALQGCLSYGIAGVAKASAQGWRDGSYLIGICGTHIYGHAALADRLRRRPELAKGLSRLLVTWECAFPLVLVAPRPLALAILASGALFHIANGYIMGLNTFIWAFIATYPAILYCIQARGW